MTDRGQRYVVIALEETDQGKLPVRLRYTNDKSYAERQAVILASRRGWSHGQVEDRGPRT